MVDEISTEPKVLTREEKVQQEALEASIKHRQATIAGQMRPDGTRNVGGQPRKQVDTALIVKLAGEFCTNKEIAAKLGINSVTLLKNFSEFLVEGRANAHVSLRSAQYRKGVVEGNTNMLIHMGKQYLGQTDRTDINLNESSTTINVTADNVADKIDSILKKALTRESIGADVIEGELSIDVSYTDDVDSKPLASIDESSDLTNNMGKEIELYDGRSRKDKPADLEAEEEEIEIITSANLQPDDYGSRGRSTDTNDDANDTGDTLEVNGIVLSGTELSKLRQTSSY